MTQKLFVWRQPDPYTIAFVTHADAPPGDQWEEMDQQTYDAWRDAQPFPESSFPPGNGQTQPDVYGFFTEIATNPQINDALGDVLSRLIARKTEDNPVHDPIAALALSAGLQDLAKTGETAVFLVGWGKAVATGLISPGLITGMQALAAAFRLPSEFIDALQPGDAS